MSDRTDDSLLDELSDEFTQRLRQGERPPIDEYVGKYPQLASDIREIFPTLMLMESSQVTLNASQVGSPDRRGELELARFGNYRLLREVGRGGMGVVYEAMHDTLGRRVALKVLATHLVADTRHLERFRREAKAAAKLHHPNIVAVYDVGEIDGVLYYTMQFIDGEPLIACMDDNQFALTSFPTSSLIGQATQFSGTAKLENPDDPNARAAPKQEEHPVSAGRDPRRPQTVNKSTGVNEVRHGTLGESHFRYIARLGEQIANALGYAHGEGVIHRDIKPANLLLDARGAVWITDFGLAQVGGQDELTSPGDVVGTLRYLPPERFEGHVDQRGDIYSLGVTLYEMLTLRPAFAASTRARLIDQILHVEPLAPRRIDRQLPRALETIVLKAMAREPSQRYATAAGLAEDLGRFLTDRPILARRPTAAEHAWHWYRRNKALASMIALTAALLVVILCLSLVDSVQMRNQLHQTQMARRETRERLYDSLVS